MNYALDAVYGCRLADGRTDKDGYVFWGKTRAHIVAWVAINGAVPDGLVLDHGCSRRNCCAPHHLEPVTQSENLKRRNWRYRMRIAKCPRGLHDMKLHGVVMPTKGRVCRECNREAKG